MQETVITKNESAAEELQHAFAQMFDRLLIISNSEQQHEQRKQ